jgi:hypothetical protein
MTFGSGICCLYGGRSPHPKLDLTGLVSQNGEDGIIAEIFSRIGCTDRIFVEIGAGDGLVNNTAYLLFRGWQGFWFEVNEDAVAAIEQRFHKRIAGASKGEQGILHCRNRRRNIG